MWDPTARKVIINRDVTFVEDKVQINEGDNTVKESSKTTSVQAKNNPEHEDVNSSEATPGHEEQEPVKAEAPKIRRSTRERRPLA